MRILITHVTRMAPGFCCVAGITEGDHRHVRPTLGRRLGTELLVPGGPFDFGALVELGRVVPEPSPPEVEDHRFDPAATRQLGHVSAERLWQVLSESAAETLADIFGEEMERRGGRGFLPLGTGPASLGCYRPAGPVDLVLRDDGDKKSLRIRLPGEGLDLSLTDARYFQDAFSAPDMSRIARAQAALADGDEVLLGVGVGRPFASAPDQPEVHWLQVNALHLKSNPALRLRAPGEHEQP
ncbi:MAG: hypothetical protein HY875_11925 [Chloroflexi bacterium]|nr:hypothetical protein [Chloroflexota bacterium]